MKLSPSISRFFYTLLLVLLAGIKPLAGQSTVSGKIIESLTGKPLHGATVIINGKKGTSTGADGKFLLSDLVKGKHRLTVRMLGYAQSVKEVDTGIGDTLKIEFRLEDLPFETGEVFVTATRNQSNIASVAGRIAMLDRSFLSSVGSNSPDELLLSVPGINLSRSFGIFSHKSTVSMRGLSGNEQGRVLVLIDNIPVNKADGGSVNWNMIDPESIERIEVVKGPSSSLYGGNAMGGTINIITKKPGEETDGVLKAGYGTYGTFSGKVSLGKRYNLKKTSKPWFRGSAFYRKSNGYITQSEYDRSINPYIVPTTLDEAGGTITAGAGIGRKSTIEAQAILYNDRRGGIEKIYQPDGNSTDHDTYQFSTKYRYEGDKLEADVNVFWMKEYYQKVNEFKRDDYTFYKVLSGRTDMGILSSASWKSGSDNTLTAGMDIRLGSVDARDIYFTSTDIVYNKGKMLNSGFFMQNESLLAEGKIKIIAGLRYDIATFSDGAFFIDSPSGETSFMTNLVNHSMAAVKHNALSPRLSASFRISEKVKIYASAARGFRPSVLDDLCRSGRIRGGFKIANPALAPEFLSNIETGADISLTRKFKAAVSLFYSRGKDFMYYVNSGDSIDMGFGLRPIFIRTNIQSVNIFGAEGEVNYNVAKGLSVKGSISITGSEITKYQKLDSSDPVDLTGKKLTDVPSFITSINALWENRMICTGLTVRYQSRMWVNDLNIFDEVVGSDMYPSFITADIRIWKEIGKHFTANITVQNIFDTKYFDSKGAVCPGRFIMAEAGFRF